MRVGACGLFWCIMQDLLQELDPDFYREARLHLAHLELEQLRRERCELPERQAFGRTVTLREVLEMAARRFSAGDHYVGDAAAEITVLRQIAEKVPIAEARTEILKAVAVLRDRVGR